MSDIINIPFLQCIDKIFGMKRARMFFHQFGRYLKQDYLKKNLVLCNVLGHFQIFYYKCIVFESKSIGNRLKTLQKTRFSWDTFALRQMMKIIFLDCGSSGKKTGKYQLCAEFHLIAIISFFREKKSNLFKITIQGNDFFFLWPKRSGMYYS